MTEPYGTPMPETPKKNNTTLIIVIALVVVCCCCVVGAGVAWQFGDQILYELGLSVY